MHSRLSKNANTFTFSHVAKCDDFQVETSYNHKMKVSLKFNQLHKVAIMIPTQHLKIHTMNA